MGFIGFLCTKLIPIIIGKSQYVLKIPVLKLGAVYKCFLEYFAFYPSVHVCGDTGFCYVLSDWKRLQYQLQDVFFRGWSSQCLSVEDTAQVCVLH